MYVNKPDVAYIRVLSIPLTSWFPYAERPIPPTSYLWAGGKHVGVLSVQQKSTARVLSLEFLVQRRFYEETAVSSTENLANSDPAVQHSNVLLFSPWWLNVWRSKWFILSHCNSRLHYVSLTYRAVLATRTRYLKWQCNAWMCLVAITNKSEKCKSWQ